MSSSQTVNPYQLSTNGKTPIFLKAKDIAKHNVEMKHEISNVTDVTKIFDFNNINVRVAIENDEPWFCAKDICDILGLVNSRATIMRIKEKNRCVKNFDTAFGFKDMNCVNEQGLYKLIFTSNKPIAEEFQDFVFEQVLPAIRKQGFYSVNGAKNEMEQIELELKKEQVNALKIANESARLKNDTIEIGNRKLDQGRLVEAKDIFEKVHDDRAVMLCLDLIKNNLAPKTELKLLENKHPTEPEMLSLSEYLFKTWGIVPHTTGVWMTKIKLPNGTFGGIANYIKQQYRARNDDQSPRKATKYVNGHHVQARQNEQGHNLGVAIYSPEEYEEYIHDILEEYLHHFRTFTGKIVRNKSKNY